MKIAAAAGFALALTLGACAQNQNGSRQDSPVMAAPTSVPFGGLKMLILGENFDDVLNNRMKLASALESMGTVNVPPGPQYIRRLITGLKAAEAAGSGNLPGLTGHNGIYGRVLLWAAGWKLKTGGNYDPKLQVNLTIAGQILDYQYNAGTGAGKLQSETYITRTITLPPTTPGITPPPLTQAYRWTIEVKNGGYSVQNHSGDNDDPFPGTLPFPQGALDRIMTKGFNKKLWATGTDIEVKKVEFNANYGTNPNNFTPIPDNPANHNLYTPTAESCIDMMFKIAGASGPGSFVPETKQQLLDYVASSSNGNPGYCLGRCSRPLLVNTGL